MRFGTWCFVAFALCVTVTGGVGAADDFDYSRAADMRGSKYVYIDTGSDLNTHTDLADRIEKSTGLKVVASDEPTDLVITWTAADANCGTAKVLRMRGEKRRPLLVFDWNDCGKRFVPATFLFVRKFREANQVSGEK